MVGEHPPIGVPPDRAVNLGCVIGFPTSLGLRAASKTSMGWEKKRRGNTWQVICQVWFVSSGVVRLSSLSHCGGWRGTISDSDSMSIDLSDCGQPRGAREGSIRRPNLVLLRFPDSTVPACCPQHGSTLRACYLVPAANRHGADVGVIPSLFEWPVLLWVG